MVHGNNNMAMAMTMAIVYPKFKSISISTCLPCHALPIILASTNNKKGRESKGSISSIDPHPHLTKLGEKGKLKRKQVVTLSEWMMLRKRRTTQREA